MVIRASEPRRSANSSCVDPKISRKSLARNFPTLRAAEAVMVFIDILRRRWKPPTFQRRVVCNRMSRAGSAVTRMISWTISQLLPAGRSMKLGVEIRKSRSLFGRGAYLLVASFNQSDACPLPTPSKSVGDQRPDNLRVDQRDFVARRGHRLRRRKFARTSARPGGGSCIRLHQVPLM